MPATAGTFTVNLPAANGDVVVTGGGSTVQFGAGSVSAPSITFSGDTNTGIYSPAADTIAFTEGGVEAMRIDASGNVGIGSSANNVFDQIASARPLLVQSASSSTTIAGSSNSITITNSDTTTNNSSQINFAAITGASANQYSTAVISAVHGARTNGQYPSGALVFSVAGGSNTAPTERARITSGGNFLIGTTTDIGARLRVNGNSYFDNLVYFPAAYNQTTGNPANAHIASDGNLFRSTSSRKYKREIQDATFGLNDVLALRPVTYKGNSEADGDAVFGGLIAEEVHEAGLTYFVQYAGDGTPDALAYGNMVALCVKAIQELKAKNDALEARLAAVEAR